MKKTLVFILCAMLIMAVVPVQAAQLPLSLRLLQAGFDSGTEDAVYVKPDVETNTLVLARSLLEETEVFEIIVLTDLEVDPSFQYDATFFEVEEIEGLELERSVLVIETDKTYYGWTLTIPSASLLELAQGDEESYAFVFTAVDKEMANGDTVKQAEPFVVTVNFVDAVDDKDAAEAADGQLGKGATITGVREMLNVRSLPFDKTAPIGRVKAGERVEVLDQDATGEWVQIVFQDGKVQGWVPIENLLFDE